MHVHASVTGTKSSSLEDELQVPAERSACGLDPVESFFVVRAYRARTVSNISNIFLDFLYYNLLQTAEKYAHIMLILM